jgi:16S rRNA (guanine966-N2)-methyltransferase
MKIKLQIIGGALKRRNILITKNDNVRPILTRIRQTIFDILYNYIDIRGKIALDVCCGTGILGIEFLSKAGERVHFLDINKENIKELKINTSKLEIFDKCKFINENALTPPKGEYVDILFLDPPYKSGFLIKKILRRLNEKNWIGEETIIVVPMDKEFKHPLAQEYNLFRETVIASTRIVFLTKNNICENINNTDENIL